MVSRSCGKWFSYVVSIHRRNGVYEGRSTILHRGTRLRAAGDICFSGPDRDALYQRLCFVAKATAQSMPAPGGLPKSAAPSLKVMREALGLARQRLGAGMVDASVAGELALLIAIVARDGCHDPASLADMALDRLYADHVDMV